MGKIVVTKNRGMKLWAKFALVTLCSLLLSAFIDKPAFALNPLMHNSSTMGNKYGSWGGDKGCTWCHAASATNNVKKVAQTIYTPNGPRNVVFYRMTAASNDTIGVFGNDIRTYNVNSSSNVCEVCHRQTTYHRYSAQASPSTGHYNNKQCTNCHQHADGFRAQGHEVPFYASANHGGHESCSSSATGCHTNTVAGTPYPTAGGSPPDCRACHAKADPMNVANGCGSCHGVANGNGEPSGTVYPDAAGSHAKHTADTVNDCSPCHSAGGTGGNEAHGKGSRGVNPAIVDVEATFGWYSASNKKTCSTASCHANVYGPGTVTTPKWGSTGNNCSACHSIAIGVTGPATGSHVGHKLTDCAQCHAAGTTSTSNPPSGHRDATIDVYNGYPPNIAKHAAGSGYYTCSTAPCHANPYKGSLANMSTIVSPVWGNNVGCAACHVGIGAFVANGAPNTGSHGVHMALSGAVCNKCHDGAESGVSGGSLHANTRVDVSNAYSASPVPKHAAGAYTGYCSSATCHVSPYDNIPLVSPVWGATTGCSSCHKDAGAFTVAGPNTGSHSKHMLLYNAACAQCHSGAVLNVSGGDNHLSEKVEVTNVGYTASPVNKHPIGTYDGTCANTCHADGNGLQISSPKWGVTPSGNCIVCHGGAADVTPVTSILNTNKHRSHMNNHSTLGAGNDLACAECHAKTVSMGSDIILTGSSHLNNLKDYSGARAGRMQTAFGQTTCTNNYCHSSGQAVPVFSNLTGSKRWSSTAKFDCAGCHGRSVGASWKTSLGAPNYANHSSVSTANSHEKHVIRNEMASTGGCAKCHLSTVDRGVANKLRDYTTAHINGKRDVQFSIYGIYSSSTKSCTTYCHSNVQAPGGDGPATIYAKPRWGSDNGSIICGSCHASMGALAENPQDLLLGSHKRHTVDSAYQCSICHGTGYSSNNTVGATHADGNINLSFTARGGTVDGVTSPIDYSQTVNVAGDGYGTCSSSACHGRSTKNWGDNTSKPVCEKCHGSTATARTTGVFADTAGSTAGPFAGTHVSHLKGSHGISRQLECNDCHKVPSSTNSFGHMTSLPAKMNWGFMATYSSHRPGYAGVNMNPSFTGSPDRECLNTYCHAGVRKSDGSAQGSNTAPTWGELSYLGGGTAACNKCHMYPPPLPHNQSTNCNACHNHVNLSNVAFADKSKHIDGTIQTTVDECLGCHSSLNVCSGSDPGCINKELVGAHKNHTDAELFLQGKKLSTGDYDDLSWIYGIKYEKGFPHFACGFCHPMNNGLHKNGVVDLDLDPSNALPGTVKTKNKTAQGAGQSTWVTTYVANTNVVCNNVYCHSNGYASPEYTFKATPNWYAVNPWAGQDRCNKCHGNSPNTGGTVGSSAHARHSVASHYEDVYNNYSGKFPASGGAGTGAAHGDPATSTTYNCNICHYGTVRDSFNDYNGVCLSCHTGAQGKGAMNVYTSGSLHVNGEVNVDFKDPFVLKSKTQLRDNLASVFSLSTSWTRTNGYKSKTSYDSAKTTPSYVGGSCSAVSCHNGTPMEWRTLGPLECSACHNGLPQ